MIDIFKRDVRFHLRKPEQRLLTNIRILNAYSMSGRLLKKYNVEEAGTAGIGGEYVVQDGFGWTNAILLRFMTRLGIDK